MAETTRERPILFSAPMVRALLDGRKTQTRRVCKPAEKLRGNYRGSKVIHRPDGVKNVVGKTRHWEFKGVLDDWIGGVPVPKSYIENFVFDCPYGTVGGNLWARETWAYYGGDEYLYQRIPENVVYAADFADDPRSREWQVTRWKPSIHMPRWASRLTLEITGVRVERVQSISAADCVAEGMAPTMRNEPPVKERFADLWKEINGDGSWAANPWVWAISFRRINPEPRR